MNVAPRKKVENEATREEIGKKSRLYNFSGKDFPDTDGQDKEQAKVLHNYLDRTLVDNSIEQKAEGISKGSATLATYAHRCCVG